MYPFLHFFPAWVFLFALVFVACAFPSPFKSPDLPPVLRSAEFQERALRCLPPCSNRDRRGTRQRPGGHRHIGKGGCVATPIIHEYLSTLNYIR